MTNRSKTRTNRQPPKIRCVNLTFQPHHAMHGQPQCVQGPTRQPQDETGRPGQFNYSDTPHGFRPHGGNRGIKKHPTNAFSYTKNAEYHKKLREDIDKLFDDEVKEKNPTPRWVHDVMKEKTHSGENPLLTNKHLSPSKHEQQMEYIRLAQVLLEENRSRMSSRSSTSMPAYHRANSAHQYMEATDLPVSEVDSKLGRPTRTTLLRSRQRTASAPLTSHEIRKEAKKRAKEIIDQRSRPMTAVSHREILFMPSVEKGDTAHAFLTGARYNRAHYLDSKSLSKYGVYLPRDNPMATFITQKPAAKTVQTPETPAAPPSPVDIPIPERTNSPVEQPPTQKGRQAWTENNSTQVHHDVNKTSGPRQISRSILHDASKNDDSLGGEQMELNITGQRLGGLGAPNNSPRVRSACSPGRLGPKSPLMFTSSEGRELPPTRGLPVCIGKSIYNIPFTPEAIRNSSFTNQPRSSPMVSARDVAEKLNADILNIGAEISEIRLDEGVSVLPVPDHVIKKETALDDVNDDGGEVEDSDGQVEKEGRKEEAVINGNIEDLANQNEADKMAANEDLEVESCGQGEPVVDDNVEFFLTEEGGEKFVNGGREEGDQDVSQTHKGIADVEVNVQGGRDEEEEQKADGPQDDVLMENEEKASIFGSEMSTVSELETARETFAPVISVDISRKSTENMPTDVEDG